MTYQNDPNRRSTRAEAQTNSTLYWIIGAVLTVAVGLFLAFGSGMSNNVANTTTTRPAVTTGSSTGNATRIEEPALPGSLLNNQAVPARPASR